MTYKDIRRLAAILVVLGGFYMGAGASAAQAAVIRPTELDIPAIQATVPLVNVGLTPAGNMEVPNNFVQAGWYKYGTMPGMIGSAVIAAHVDSGGYKPYIDGVFKNLDAAAIGSIAHIQLSDGTNLRFEIISAAVYPYRSFPSDLVFNQTGSALLKIITCHGTWLPSAHTYSERYVVTAVRV